MAREYGYQYVVTMNSDFMQSVEVQSDGTF